MQMTTIIEIIFFGGYLLLMCWATHIFLKDMYNTAIPDINFYLASSVDTTISNHSLYNITVFKKQDDNITDDSFMIFLQPQNLYFFIEDKGEHVIYHPNNRNNNQKTTETTFKCKDNINYEIAYSFSLKNNKKIKVICHRNLEYLKKMYTQRVFYKTFESLQDPIKVITISVNNYTDNEMLII